MDLEKAAWVVCFEMFQLRYYADVFERSPRPDRFRTVLGHSIGRAYEYALLIHFRVLLDFFFVAPNSKNKRAPDDIWVGHFGPTLYVKESFDLGEVQTQLNKRLAHLTCSRWTNPDHWGMDDYRLRWVVVLELIDRFEMALVGNPKRAFDTRMAAFKADIDDHRFLKQSIS